MANNNTKIDEVKTFINNFNPDTNSIKDIKKNIDICQTIINRLDKEIRSNENNIKKGKSNNISRINNNIIRLRKYIVDLDNLNTLLKNYPKSNKFSIWPFKKQTKIVGNSKSNNTKEKKKTIKSFLRWGKKNSYQIKVDNKEEEQLPVPPPRRAWNKLTQKSQSSPNKSNQTRNNTVSRRRSTIQKPIEIKHFWYSGWPDHGVPTTEEQLFTFKLFIKELLKDIKGYHCNTLIHCSAGVGRTGTTYVILKICLDNDIDDLSNYEGKILYDDIKAAITHARKGRNHMVQSVEQLKFICSLFNVEENILERPFDEITPLVAKVHVVTFDNTKIIDNDKNFHPNCEKLNRYKNILPWADDTHVKIKKKDGDECSTYVNASYILDDENNFFNGKVISSDCPNIDSKNNFLRMLGEINIERIIMVTNLTEKKIEKLIEKNVLKCENYTENPNFGLINEDNNNTLYGSAHYYNLSSDYTELSLSRPYETESPIKRLNISNTTEETSNDSELLEPEKTSYKKSNQLQNYNTKLFIERLKDFLEIHNNLSFCDAKIILLYILLFYSINKNDYDNIYYDKAKEIMLINRSNRDENVKVIDNTIILINIFLKNKQNLLFNTLSCSGNGLGQYIDNYKKAYKILFGVNNDENYKTIVDEYICNIFNDYSNYIPGRSVKMNELLKYNMENNLIS